MSGLFWYLLITFISLTIFLYTLIKIKDKKIIAVYTFLAGIVYLFEYVVLILLKSYLYKPGLLKDAYFDSILGSIASNAFSVPMLGTFVAAFQLKWPWIVLIIGLFYLVEEFFLYINIYQHFWWRTPFTAIGLFLFFSIAKKWFLHLKGSMPNPIRFLTLYFTNVLIQATFVYVIVAFFGMYHYEIGWFHDKSRDHVAFSSVYIFALGLIFTAIIFFRFNWKWKAVIILATLFIDYFLLKNKILFQSPQWELGYFILLRFFIVGILQVFETFIVTPKNKKE